MRLYQLSRRGKKDDGANLSNQTIMPIVEWPSQLRASKNIEVQFVACHAPDKLGKQRGQGAPA